MQQVMQAKSQDTELKGLFEGLKQELRNFPENFRSLELEFESAAKHIPAYLKIVKGHIDQLAKVLQLETHDRRNLESVGLAEPVIQLMQLFRELEETDLQMLETLAYESRNWQYDSEKGNVREVASSEV